MVKQVPLQTELTENLNVGSEVQFAGSSVEAMDNKTPSAIKRQSTSLLQFQKAAQGLADELNDAESKKLYNEFYSELENNHNEYLEFKGLDAVGYINTEDKTETKNQLDVYRNDNLQNLLEKYSNRASNGQVKYMFETRAGVSINDSQNKMTQHSIKQQRIGLENTLTDHLDITKREIIDDYEKVNVPGSVYETRKLVGLALIDEIAMLNGENIDPTKGRVSSQYLARRNKYLLEVHMGVVDKMKTEKKSHKEIEEYILKFKPDFGEQISDNLLEINEKEAIVHNFNKCVDAIIRDNSNTNNGDFISLSNKMLCLSSSNTLNDGKGAAVVDGLHTDEIDTNEKKQNENIEISEQILNSQSKFYRPDSALNGTLLNQHRATHMFAALHLGVGNADALYTKAKSLVNIDPKQFKNNPVYAKNINAQIITNYKNLIIENADKKYRPEINEIKQKIEKLQNTPDVYKKRISSNLGPFPGTKEFEKSEKDRKKRVKINQLKNQLQLAEATDSKFVEKISSDLNILENDIDYDYNFNLEKNNANPVTGLLPIETYVNKLKATIIDPEELTEALKDLRIKYNDIEKANQKVYNENLNKAKTISYAREGGHNDLLNNGIDISKFTEEDQKILKNGQPENSNVDALITINNNPENIVQNINENSHLLSKKDFLALQDYAAKLNTEEKVFAVKLENDMLDLTLLKMGFSDLINNKTDSSDEVKLNYVEIQEEWRKKIDEEQIMRGKIIGREDKRIILEGILNDKVFTGEKTGGIFGLGAKRVEQPLSTINQYDGNDQMPNISVDVLGENVVLSKIPAYQRIKIVAELKRINKPTTAFNIADYWVRGGKSTANNEIEELLFRSNQN